MIQYEDAASRFLDQMAETRWDISEFARLLGVSTHEGQRKMFDAVLKRDSKGIKPMYLNVAVSAGNRAGKTLGLAITVLHHAFHKMGLPPPMDETTEAYEKWMKHPYHWYHFGIQQEVADLVWQEMDMLLDGVHPAQKGNGCPLTKFMGRKSVITDSKERGDYRWVRFADYLGGGEIHFRTTNEKAVGQLGKDMNGISYDECGFDPNLTFIVNEVLHFRRLSTAGPLILIATPSESFRQFADEWEKGNPSSPDRVPYHFSVRMSTRDNIGFGIDQSYFDRLVAAMPKHLIPQNVDGYFIESRNAFFDALAIEQMFDRDMAEEQAPEQLHSYVQGVDPAISHDSTWSIILDYTTPDRVVGVKATRREGKQSLPNLVSMISVNHAVFNSPKGARCLTACDVSGFGGKVFRDALSDVNPFRGVEFGGTRSKKMKLLTDLKGYIEKGWLKVPRSGVWLDLRRQLLNYRLDDTKLETDAVMALAVAVSQLVRSAAQATWEQSVKFDMFGEEPVPKVPRREDKQELRNPGQVDERGVGYVSRRIKVHHGDA